jgi:hypothetical protein
MAVIQTIPARRPAEPSAILLGRATATGLSLSSGLDAPFTLSVTIKAAATYKRWMVRQAQLLLVGLVILAAAAGSALAATPAPQLLVAVSATGGFCPPNMCHWSARITTTTISAEGRRSRRITAAERAALTQAIARLRVATLPKFKGTCPIAYDGQELHYRFRGKPEIRTCKQDLRRVRAVQLVDRMIASLPSR